MKTIFSKPKFILFSFPHDSLRNNLLGGRRLGVGGYTMNSLGDFGGRNLGKHHYGKSMYVGSL